MAVVETIPVSGARYIDATLRGSIGVKTASGLGFAHRRSPHAHDSPVASVWYE
jgi:hypothetical protein